MKSRFALPALVAVMVAGCTPQTPGELGNGGFTYNCSQTKLDLACARSILDEARVPAVIAVGASFQMEYSADEESSASVVSMFPAAPGVLASFAGFTFQKAGTVALLAQDSSGRIVDFVHLRGAEIDHVAIANRLGKAITQLDLGESGHADLEATPEDASDATLSGGLEYAWESSDESVVELSPGVDENQVDVFAKASGTATIKVTVLGKSTEIPVVVGGTP